VHGIVHFPWALPLAPTALGLTCSVKINGEERTTIGRGDFFGEMSLLLGVPPSADVTARTPLRCLVLAGPELHGFLDKYPTIMYRMLVAMARRLRAANRQSG